MKMKQERKGKKTMAPLFDEIKKKVTTTTQNAVKATKDMLETSRLNTQIADEQRKMNNCYTQIGKLYFEKYGAETEAPFDELCAGIISANAQIEKLEWEIQQIKGTKHCPNCGAEISAAAGFCSGCGAAVEIIVPPQDEVDSADGMVSTETNAAIENVRHCSHCGDVLESGALFCASCGQKNEA
jgi:predicted nucleic acid-binding Zn ribbon protein